MFVERLELDFEGNLFANALTLGDVDNDGVSYLAMSILIFITRTRSFKGILRDVKAN